MKICLLWCCEDVLFQCEKVLEKDYYGIRAAKKIICIKNFYIPFITSWRFFSLGLRVLKISYKNIKLSSILKFNKKT